VIQKGQIWKNNLVGSFLKNSLKTKIGGKSKLTLLLAARHHCIGRHATPTHLTGARTPDEDMPFMDTTTSSWSGTKRSFKYGTLVLMFFHKLFLELIAN
jgi:hypothetical protein